MDANLIKQLRDAGGLVGFTNEDEWAQLVQVHGLERVLEAVVRVKKVSGRGAFISGVRVDLGAKAREPAPPKVTVAPVAAAATVEEELEAEHEAIDEESGNDLDDQVDDADETEASTVVDLRESTPVKQRAKAVDWRSALRAHPGSTKREIADATGGTQAAFHTWIYNHRADVVDCGTPNGTNKPRRYWLKDDPGAPKPGEAPSNEGMSAQAGETPAPPTTTSAAPMPQVAHATITIEVDGDPIVSGATVVSEAASAPVIVTGEDLREKLLDVDPPKAGVFIMEHELAGPLRPLLELLLDAFAHRRGYAYTVRELAACQDLVGARR